MKEKLLRFILEGRFLFHFMRVCLCPVIKMCEATITFGINKAGNIHMECISL